MIKQSKKARTLAGETAYRGVLVKDIRGAELLWNRHRPDFKGLGYGPDGQPMRADHFAGHEVIFTRALDGFFQVYFLDGYMCMLSEPAARDRLRCHRGPDGMPIKADARTHAKAALDYLNTTGSKA